ncbi:DUF808 domain-containing protein [Dietzia sp. PP-33]|jgi:predicted DNA repair protein MutK|uniref:DUF808 domain-containing protein n=1 Tax=Dietzia sp. PP-33 TaxID=2957500 RepID=UPI0029ADE7DF|nr:DUF808 domain-containing protein [Dietzia sp. PP-33]MDX2355807.1 DUF808 domain-containing protein [Dietzia sp. PP-33]
MAGGLAALLDDVAVLARMAAASTDDIAAAAGRASVKAAGVVVDDTAVTPQYVRDVDPSRELPIIRRIATGSLGNKAVIIVLALLLSQFVPWILTPILMLGGLYLCYEGAEKVWERVSGHHEKAAPVVEKGPEAEARMVRGAVTTDFILSAEIMVIALNEVTDEPFWTRAAILVVVGLFITALVYGVVSVIVKMDDVGLHLAGRDSPTTRRFGLGLVKAMPGVLEVISFVGMLAMLWVGGHILLVGLDELGVTAPYHLVHVLEEPAAAVAGIGAVLGWLVNTACSLVFGLVVGAVVVAVAHLMPRRGRTSGESRH